MATASEMLSIMENFALYFLNPLQNSIDGTGGKNATAAHHSEISLSARA